MSNRLKLLIVTATISIRNTLRVCLYIARGVLESSIRAGSNTLQRWLGGLGYKTPRLPLSHGADQDELLARMIAEFQTEKNEDRNANDLTQSRQQR